MDSLLPELQFLGNDHHREPDLRILKTLVETVYIILGKGTKEVRTEMKKMGAYLVMRELHLDIEDDGVRAACERVVDVLMIDEENEGASRKKNEEREDEKQEARITESPDAPTSHQDLVITETTKASLDKASASAYSEKEQRSPPSQLAKPLSECPPPLTTPVPDTKHDNDKGKTEANDDDDDDENDNRIVEIF